MFILFHQNDHSEGGGGDAVGVFTTLNEAKEHQIPKDHFRHSSHLSIYEIVKTGTGLVRRAWLYPKDSSRYEGNSRWQTGAPEDELVDECAPTDHDWKMGKDGEFCRDCGVRKYSRRAPGGSPADYGPSIPSREK